MFFQLTVSATTASAAVSLYVITYGCCARFEFSNRKRYGVEEYTRAFIAGCRHALLVGYAVIGSLDKKLCGAHNSNYGKYAEGHEQSCALVAGTYVTACALANAGGNLAATIITTALTVNHLLSEDDRLNCLNYRNGRVVADKCGITHTAEAALTVGGKRTQISFPTVKNNVFFEDGNTCEALAPANANTALALDLYVVPDRDTVKAAVKGYRIDTYVSGDKLGVLDAHAARGGDYFLSVLVEINSCILKAVSVAARVKHSFRVYAHGTSGICKGAA